MTSKQFALMTTTVTVFILFLTFTFISINFCLCSVEESGMKNSVMTNNRLTRNYNTADTNDTENRIGADTFQWTEYITSKDVKIGKSNIDECESLFSEKQEYLPQHFVEADEKLNAYLSKLNVKNVEGNTNTVPPQKWFYWIIGSHSSKSRCIL